MVRYDLRSKLEQRSLVKYVSVDSQVLAKLFVTAEPLQTCLVYSQDLANNLQFWVVARRCTMRFVVFAIACLRPGDNR